MASIDRQERRLARQRGAWRGERELKDAEFDFKFDGTPSGSLTRRTSSATPAAASTQRKRLQSASRSTTQTPAGPATSKRGRPSSALIETATAKTALVTPAPPTGKRKRQSERENKSAKFRRITSQERTASLDLEEDELEQISPEHETSLLKSIGRTPSAHIASSATKSSSRPRTVRSARRPLADIDENSVAILTNTESGIAEEDELASVEPTVSSGRKTRSPQLTKSATAAQSTRFAPELEATVEEPTEVPDDELDVISEPAASPPEPPRPVAHRPSKVSPRRSTTHVKKRSSNASRKARTESGPSIPIRVYRLSKKSDADTDPLGAVSIPALNPSDAVSQCLAEICKLYIDKEKNKETKSARKIQALVAFKNTILDSLFDISAAQNTAYALTGRLKRVKREQGDLRAELMAVKKEREEIGLKMDGVRAEYTDWAQTEGERQELVKDLQDFRRTVEKHRESVQDQEDESDELPQVERVQDMLQEVQAIMKNGGLLQTVQNWNISMEQKLEQLPNR